MLTNKQQKRTNMTMKITKQSKANSLRGTVEEMSGADLSTCYQCRKCSSGCPVGKQTSTCPSEIVRRLNLGAGNELLESDLVWMCLACETCYGRCPNQINIPAVIDALRALAIERGVTIPQGNIPLFNRKFLDMVKIYGRSYEFPMIAAYKLGTGNVMADMDKFPTMLMKGKMALLPPSGAEKGTVKRIFEKSGRNRGKKK
jgi:heterodisulfide reductase subunit C2